MVATLGKYLQAFEIYTDGYGKAGTGSECELPYPEKNMHDHLGGGMLMPVRRSIGYKAMKFKAKILDFDEQVMALGGLVSGRSVSFSARGYFDGMRNQKVESRYAMRGEVVMCKPNKWVAGKPADIDLEVDLAAAKLTIGSTLIFDIDAEFFVFNIGGTDEMAALVRAALA